MVVGSPLPGILCAIFDFQAVPEIFITVTVDGLDLVVHFHGDVSSRMSIIYKHGHSPSLTRYIHVLVSGISVQCLDSDRAMGLRVLHFRVGTAMARSVWQLFTFLVRLSMTRK